MDKKFIALLGVELYNAIIGTATFLGVKSVSLPKESTKESKK